MQNAWHLKATVQPGGRVEVVDVELPSGASVDVFVLPSSPKQAQQRSAIDVLSEAPGQRSFKTADEVDKYLRAERDAWDRELSLAQVPYI